MDILSNRYLQRSGIKHFTLKLTASAVLAFHAEGAIAFSCPITISDSTLAGVVCSFDTFPSVTVENGGVVGGIAMSAYNPTSSFIAIDQGGVISSRGTAAISITNSSLSNGLSNSGTISADFLGISISESLINDGIFNSGAINAGNTGIKIFSTSTISGGISNTGVISVGDDFDGLVISDSVVSGDIFNSGSILATGSGEGLLIFSSTIDDISNSGTISSVDNAGIGIADISTVGNIGNSGLISGSDGLLIRSTSTVGGISNTGAISGVQHGISISGSAIAGSISNSGTISGGQDGLLISGTATISGGISNSGTIQGDTFAINISGSDVNDIDILGQSARIIGAVEAVDTDVNITSGAIFTSEGSYSVNNFNIADNAVFNMANTITATTAVNNAGTLAIASESLQTITGDYIQLTGGLFQTKISNATNYGQLDVIGTADFSESGNIFAQVEQDSSIYAGEGFSSIVSATSLDTPTDFQVSDNSFIWQFSANSNSNNVDLTATIDPTAYEACQGNYCQGAATVIIGQVGAGNSLFGPYAAVSTESAFQAAASQATPELTNENIQAIQLITRAVVDVVPMWGALHGKSAGDAMLYQPGKVWLKPYAASMTQNENNSVNGFNAIAYGVVIGRDTQLADDWLVGGAFAAGGDNMNGKSTLSGQSTSSNAYQGIVYGSKKFLHDLYFAGQALVGYENNDTSRSIPLYASTAKGSYNSWFTNLNAELGWSTHALTQNLVLTPRVDASYLFINQGAYQESGSPMDLSVASNNNSSLMLGAYGDAAYHLASLQSHYDLSLTGYGGIAGDVINNQPQTTATFVAGGPSFSTFGVQSNGVVFRGGAGLNCVSKNKPLSISFNYDLQAGNNAYSGIGSITIKREF